MFVIPCKFEKEKSIIFECVQRIKDLHPEDRILIVDSSSDDKSYYKISGAIIADVNNVNYGTNAFYYAYKNFPDEEFFYCIYDSLLINKSLKQFQKNPLTVVRHFNAPPTYIGFDESGNALTDWANNQMIEYMGFELTEPYTGVMGPMFFCSRSVLSELENIGFFKILPTNKYQLCAMERILGFTLDKLNYDIIGNSLQGEMFDFFAEYDNTYVEKVNMARW